MSLTGFDMNGFWEDSDYAEQEYVDVPLTPALLKRVERTLGYKLPAAYVELARHQNGGTPARTCHRTQESTSWAEDHVAITGIYAIGEMKPYSLLGEFGSQFMVSEWGYPEIGIYFADCPSGGHDMLCLDYRECGPTGEPSIVHVDQEHDYKVTFVAPNFEAFLRGLVSEEEFDDDA
ncbi:MAG: SMI1/KNR4 family protein [Anaerolineales bacterium]|nr:SMI1/KNR4 family protein [Anaerolineales bacterium]